MMFTNDQQDLLKAPLVTTNVKQRKQGGMSVSYIEGWHAIAEANRIFGFGNWTRETVSMEKTCPDYLNPNGNNVASYIAKVKITVVPDEGVDVVFREGTGFGQGIAKDIGQSHESAVKEAETDAMKRALMTFGNSFGLALYDKTRKDVAPPEPKQEKYTGPSKADSRPIYQGLYDGIRQIMREGDLNELVAWGDKIKTDISTIHPDWHGQLRNEYSTALHQMQQAARDADRMVAKAQEAGFPDAEVERPQA